MPDGDKIKGFGPGWVLLTKCCLVLCSTAVTLGVAWGVWLTSEQFKDVSFREQGSRYTFEMHEKERRADRLAADREREAERTMQDLKLRELRRVQSEVEARLRSLTANFGSTQEQLVDLGKTQARIIAILERLEKKVGD